MLLTLMVTRFHQHFDIFVNFSNSISVRLNRSKYSKLTCLTWKVVRKSLHSKYNGRTIIFIIQAFQSTIGIMKLLIAIIRYKMKLHIMQTRIAPTILGGRYISIHAAKGLAIFIYLVPDR
jgi:hypothetical protein